MSDEITIRMPEELRQKWLAALRSSELNGKPIKQAQGVLSNGKRGYCCLGVLQMCASGRTQRDTVRGKQLLSEAWLSRHKIGFIGRQGAAGPSPYLPALRCDAASANDDGVSFAEIADAIERHSEGF